MLRYMLILCNVLLFTATAYAVDPAEIRAKVKQHEAEVKRRQAEMQRKFQTRTTSSNPRAQAARDKYRSLQAAREAQKPRQPTAQELRAQMAAAPRPDVCLETFILAVRHANSMSQILPLLAKQHQERYKRELAQWDPAEAQKRRAEQLRE
ncbi:MAG: hypothetical protein KDB23_12700, partial [Planctomycetales bacterium]|nr:hypothetical protein [Planctomycetales bacterium]